MTWTATPHRTWRIEFATVGYIVYLTESGRVVPCAYKPRAAKWGRGKTGITRLTDFSIPTLSIAMDVCRRHAAQFKLLTRAEMARLDTAHPHEALSAADCRRRMLAAYDEFHKRITDFHAQRKGKNSDKYQSQAGRQLAKMGRVKMSRAGRDE